MTDAEFVDAIPDWPAAFDKDRLYEIEDCCQEHSMGLHRRMLLTMLTMDSERLYEVCEEEPETYFELFEKSATSVRQYRQLQELLDAAHNRLMIALCGVDTEAVDAPFTKKEFHDAIHEAKGEDGE